MALCPQNRRKDRTLSDAGTTVHGLHLARVAVTREQPVQPSQPVSRKGSAVIRCGRLDRQAPIAAHNSGQVCSEPVRTGRLTDDALAAHPAPHHRSRSAVGGFVSGSSEAPLRSGETNLANIPPCLLDVAATSHDRFGWRGGRHGAQYIPTREGIMSPGAQSGGT